MFGITRSFFPLTSWHRNQDCYISTLYQISYDVRFNSYCLFEVIFVLFILLLHYTYSFKVCSWTLISGQIFEPRWLFPLKQPWVMCKPSAHQLSACHLQAAYWTPDCCITAVLAGIFLCWMRTIPSRARLLQQFNSALKCWYSGLTWGLTWHRGPQEANYVLKELFWTNSQSYKELCVPCSLLLAAGWYITLQNKLRDCILKLICLLPSCHLIYQFTSKSCMEASCQSDTNTPRNSPESLITSIQTRAQLFWAWLKAPHRAPAYPKPSIKIILQGISAHWKPHRASLTA